MVQDTLVFAKTLNTRIQEITMVNEMIIGKTMGGAPIRWSDPAYQEIVASNITYKRWENSTGLILIGKVTITDSTDTVREKVYGLWADRATIDTYVPLYS